MAANESPGEAKANHLPSLDGLRGVAALVVVLTHSLSGVQSGSDLLIALTASPLIPLINSKIAVQVFFVLSGFVLTGSLLRNPSLRAVPQFYVRRIFRIHPPYVVALLIAWMVSFQYLPARNELSNFGDILFNVHLPFDELIGYLTFPSQAANQLPVGWTLKIEMIFSFLMPVMLWFALRTHVALLIAVFIIPFFIGPWGHPILKFGLDFSFGIGLFLYGTACTATFRRIGNLGTGVWVIAMLVIANLPLYLDWPWLIDGGSRGSIFLQSVGSAGLVAAAAYAPPISRLVTGRRCVFVGMISYSIYLLHWPAAVVASRIPWSGSDLWIVPVMFAITIPVAALSYYVVERPSIRFGNRVCSRMDRYLTPVGSSR